MSVPRRVSTDERPLYSTSTPERLLARVVRAAEAAYPGSFAIYDGRDEGPDTRFDMNARPMFWYKQACRMPLHYDARPYYIDLLEKRAVFYEKKLAAFKDEVAKREHSRAVQWWAENDRLVAKHFKVRAKWEAEKQRAHEALIAVRTVAALKQFMKDWQPPTPPANPRRARLESETAGERRARLATRYPIAP